MDYRTQPSCLSSVNHTPSKLLAPPTQTPPPAYRTYRYYTGMKGIAPNSAVLCNPDSDECAVNHGGCDINADCINTPGSYCCVCQHGYFGYGFHCFGKASSQLYILHYLFLQAFIHSFFISKTDIPQ